MMHFPLFQISPSFQSVGKIFQFPQMYVSSMKISDNLLFNHFPQCREIYCPILFEISPFDFVKFTCFLHTLRVLRLDETTATSTVAASGNANGPKRHVIAEVYRL